MTGGCGDGSTDGSVPGPDNKSCLADRLRVRVSITESVEVRVPQI